MPSIPKDSAPYSIGLLLVGLVFVAISAIMFYGSYKLFTGRDTFVRGAIGLIVAAIIFSAGIGGIFQNEAMTDLTYTFLTAAETPPSALTTSWGQSGFDDNNSYPTGTVKKYATQGLGMFPTMASLLPSSAPTSAPTFASLNPLLPTNAAAISPQAVMSTATASPAQAMQLGGVTASGLGQSQSVPFSPRPVATV